MWLQYVALDTVNPLQILLFIKKNFTHNTNICSYYTVAYLQYLDNKK